MANSIQIWIANPSNSGAKMDWYEGLLTHDHQLCMQSGLGLLNWSHTLDASETSLDYLAHDEGLRLR